MNRYNIFNQIHKGLRVVLFETATALQQTDLSDKPAGAHVIARLNRTIGYFDGHAEHEDTFILPLISKVDTDLVAKFTGEHHEDEELGKNLRELASAYISAEDPATLEDLGPKIMRAFNSFIAFNLEHMNEEEELLNSVLWQHYTDDQIRQVEHAIVSSIPPDLLDEESRFMMRGINNREIIQWLGGIKAHAPLPVFQIFVGMMKEEIAMHRSSAIQKALCN